MSQFIIDALQPTLESAKYQVVKLTSDKLIQQAALLESDTFGVKPLSKKVLKVKVHYGIIVDRKVVGYTAVYPTPVVIYGTDTWKATKAYPELVWISPTIVSKKYRGLGLGRLLKEHIHTIHTAVGTTWSKSVSDVRMRELNVKLGYVVISDNKDRTQYLWVSPDRQD